MIIHDHKVTTNAVECSGCELLLGWLEQGEGCTCRHLDDQVSTESEKGLRDSNIGDCWESPLYRVEECRSPCMAHVVARRLQIRGNHNRLNESLRFESVYSKQSICICFIPL